MTWLSEAKVARAKRVEELVKDIMDDDRMSGVPRYRHRYDEDHHLLAHEVERLHRDIDACWERIDELEDGIRRHRDRPHHTDEERPTPQEFCDFYHDYGACSEADKELHALISEDNR